MHLQEILIFHMKHCPLHHVTYVPAKFEAATANGKVDALPRKHII